VNLVAWLIVGALMGGIASLIVHPDGRRRVATNMVVGTTGAVVGGWLLSPLIGGSTADQVALSGIALLVAAAGATAFLAFSNLAYREMVR
jgi:uncharacterized membrane protein YeaQ/YmgE (transglycosylase-associated protein family)